MKQSELIFSSDISCAFRLFCRENDIRSAVVVADSNTALACLPLLASSYPVVIMPAGEANKNFSTVEQVLNQFLEYRAGRDTVVFNLGGGVVSDTGGFAASVYKRGLRYVNVPTTLLAMVDASIGGKTGVDFHSFKNYIGTFYSPEAVLISEQFLDTLDRKEWENGWAEMVKTAVVCSSELVGMISAGREERLSALLEKTARVKQQICDQDPCDRSIRQLLNFGHTIGHAWESYRLSIGDPVPHGVAVAKGMLYETALSCRLGLLDEDNSRLIIKLIEDQTSCTALNEGEFSMLQPFLHGDKKNRDGAIVFSLPTGIGRGTYGVKLAAEDVKF